MIDRKAIEISKVSVADASQIVELQNELLLNDRRDYKDGFLYPALERSSIVILLCDMNTSIR